MPSPLTLRLDPELRRRIDSIAKRRKCSTSVVVREAIQSFVEKEDPPGSFYDAVKDLIGIVDGGDPKLSENTGRKFAEGLRARRAARDSG